MGCRHWGVHVQDYCEHVVLACNEKLGVLWTLGAVTWLSLINLILSQLLECYCGSWQPMACLRTLESNCPRCTSYWRQDTACSAQRDAHQKFTISWPGAGNGPMNTVPRSRRSPKSWMPCPTSMKVSSKCRKYRYVHLSPAQTLALVWRGAQLCFRIREFEEGVVFVALVYLVFWLIL